MKTLVQMWVLLGMLISFTASETYTLINSTNLSRRGCPSRCGDVIVPYPFGIGINSNCSIGPGFDVYCNSSTAKASFTQASYTSFKLISDSTLRISNRVSTRCYLPNSAPTIELIMNFTNWPYTFSEVNKFTVIGCNDYALLTSRTKFRNISTGCMVFCSTPDDVVGDHQCSGNGCCQSSIPEDINYYTTQIRTLENSDAMNNTRSFNRPCTYAFVGEENVFKFNGAADLNVTSLRQKIEANVPIVLDWAIGNLSCIDARANDGFACQYSNSKCVDSTREIGGYRCICNEGFEGKVVIQLQTA